MDHLRRAIALARPTHPHPNPRVGAVMVDAHGVMVGEGWHLGPGTDHAEVMALAAAGPAAAGGTMFVSLEPCAHHGRTPPCADALIDAGVSRVVVAVGDPDPRVAGSGIRRLRSAGVEVIEDVLPEEAEALDPGYFHHRRSGRPRLTLKVAATLDGNTAASDLTSQWITSEEARRDAHALRAEVDAVMVGAGTVIEDDPNLDVRLDGYQGPQPRPVVIAGQRTLPEARRLWSRDALVVTTRPLEVAAETVVVAADAAGQVDLRAALTAIGERGVVDVLVEGGARLTGALLRAGLVDRGVFYFGAQLAGGVGIPVAQGSFSTLADAQKVRIESVQLVGPDVRIEFVRRDG